MDTIKELLVDALILFAAWFIVTAGGFTHTAKGLTCGRVGRVEASTQAHQP